MIDRLLRLTAVLLLLGVGPALAVGDWPQLSGPYLGQDPPGEEPVIFAPGIVSTFFGDRDLVISAAGDEIIFGMLDARAVTLRMTRLIDGFWTEPRILSFAADPEHAYLEPAYSTDGQRLLFLTNRPMPGEDKKPGWGNQNIFMAEREADGRADGQADGWGEARPAPQPLCTFEDEYYPSVTADGSVYFTRHQEGGDASIWRTRWDGSRYLEAEKLPEQANCGTENYNAFIAPDESYLIVCVVGGPGNLGQADYYVSFRSVDDRWSPAVNLGPKFNGPDWQAGSAYVSPDGEFFFFSSTRWDPTAFFPDGQVTRERLLALHRHCGNGNSDIYWVAAGFLAQLKPEGWSR